MGKNWWLGHSDRALLIAPPTARSCGWRSTNQTRGFSAIGCDAMYNICFGKTHEVLHYVQKKTEGMLTVTDQPKSRSTKNASAQSSLAIKRELKFNCNIKIETAKIQRHYFAPHRSVSNKCTSFSLQVAKKLVKKNTTKC